MPSYEQVLFELINNAKNQMRAAPLNLGGTSAAYGGAGGPPGGFIGYLPQGRVAYDTTEAYTLVNNPSGVSIVDNLNHIRYRLHTLEASGIGSAGISGIYVTGSAFFKSGVTTLDFQNVTLVDVDSTTVRVEVDTLAHNTQHQLGGSDVIKLDDLGSPDDNTDLNATTVKHGLLPKLPNDSNKYLNGLGNWVTISGTTSSGTGGSITVTNIDTSTDYSNVTIIELDNFTTSSITNGVRIIAPSGTFVENSSLWIVDAKPSSVNGLDDEFDDLSIDGKWTVFDPGSVMDDYEDITGYWMQMHTTGSAKVHGLYQAIPGGDWAIYTKVHVYPGPGYAQYAGLFLIEDTGNPATTEIDLIGIYTDGTVTTKEIMATNIANYTSNLLTNANHADNIAVLGNGVYLRMALVSGNREFSYSLDGFSWITVGSGGSTTSPTGFGIFSHFSTNYYAPWLGRNSFDFFRKNTITSFSSPLYGSRIRIGNH